MGNENKPLLISIVGPTAVGKTSLAIALAREFGTEIVSADSRQFYRELSIGTAKPSQDELAAEKHHFIDSHSVTELYSAGQYGRDAQTLLDRLFQEKPVVVAVGGSSLYLKALWEGFDEMPAIDSKIRAQLNEELLERGLEPLLEELLQADPDYYDTVDRHNRQRIVRALEVIRGTGKPFSSFRNQQQTERSYRNLKIGLDLPREVLFERINRRMDEMIEQGLFDEAMALCEFRDHNALQTVGYSEIFDFMDGQYDKEECIRLLKRNSRRYAKRQMTWFRKYDDIVWFDPSEFERIVQMINKELNTVKL